MGPIAWLCNDAEKVTCSTSEGTPSPPIEPTTAFARVTDRGALGYRHFGLVEQGVPDAEFQPGFFLGIEARRSNETGDWFSLTTSGLWVTERDLTTLEASRFAGVAVTGALDMGWLHTTRAIPRSSIAGMLRQTRPLSRLSRVNVRQVMDHNGRRWYQTDYGWLSQSELRVPELSSPPSQLLPEERWIDVDTLHQTLVAYVGSRPVYATMVSTGRGRAGSARATPLGEFRVWAKLLATDMDNLDDPEAVTSYVLESVPWVLFFHRGYGLHGTYWHDAFGNPKSHGCINLSLADARWLFAFASPILPAGWRAVHPTVYDRGTLIRIR